MKSVDQGAATVVLVAASPLVTGTSGEYWADCQVAKGSKYLDDSAIAQKLGAVSEGIVSQRTFPLQ